MALLSELRKDPVLGRWVIISTARGKRPQGFADPLKEAEGAVCPFCFGNEHMTPPEIYALGPQSRPANHRGWRVRVVANKYPALGVDGPLAKQGRGIFDTMTGFGAHEVVIETPDHKRDLKDLSAEELGDVIRVLQLRMEDLYKDKRLRYALVFRNKGQVAGASLPHPHSQIIATPITPQLVREELQGAEAYFKLKERCIFCDVLLQERESGERVVYENEGFVSFCPFASRFPYELAVYPKHHGIDFHAPEVVSALPQLADCLRVTLRKLAKVLEDPQYNLMIHAAPNRFTRRGYWQTIEEDYHWHIEIIPRLTRVAGFEWGTGFYINVTAPEEAARTLREATL